ncbi:hypothetical protein RJ639_001041 [Escallonia herrerae]|uniref:Uncharacterized protein n=1 Tax=Escallonia herrerae TaxID=1293975 RepID=A0AA88XQZ1_9ASTE|nr:hypothetical protein RJ639_001041 [Escallonia herrerae]
MGNEILEVKPDKVRYQFVRNYFRCTHKFDQGCQATMQVQMTEDEPAMYKTTYHGFHTCKNLLKAPQIILNSTHPATDSSYLLCFDSDRIEKSKEHKQIFPMSDYLMSPDLTTLDSPGPMTVLSPGSDHGDVLSSGVYSCTATASTYSSFGMDTMGSVDFADDDNIINGLGKEGDSLPERFKAQCLVEKLPDSWKEFKLKFRQKRHAITLQETIVYIKVEAQNKKLQMIGRAKEMMAKANVVEVGPTMLQQSQNRGHGYKPYGRPQFSNYNRGQVSNPQIHQKKGECFVCGKAGHYPNVCRYWKGDQHNNNSQHSCHNNNNNSRRAPPRARANVVEADNDVIAIVISEVNLVT